jgi:hypothetical protein
MLSFEFPVTMARRGHLKFAKITIFHLKGFQSAATSQWIEIVSKAFQRW